MQKSSAEILTQLARLVKQLTTEQYNFILPGFSGGSVGKHVRHVIECYKCFLQGIQNGTVNYDKRQRNITIETDKYVALQLLNDIIHEVDCIETDVSLQLQIDLSHEEKETHIETSCFRELAYNIEHAIHHMAIIKIGVMNHFADVRVDENFGIAYSTIRYQEQEKLKILEN